jgi:DHA1 family bicyclomycin/chloramphenicol resistance-like MFS transporter
MPSSLTSNRMSSGLVVLVLTLLLGLQPITTDLYLPALPALTQGFGARCPTVSAAARCCWPA